MQHSPLQKPVCLRLGFLICSLGLAVPCIRAQCLNRIDILSGTQQIACTEVTVTSSGDVTNGPGCDGGPYKIGTLAPGSYTFSFSPPVTGVTLGVSRIDNHDFIGFGHEEVSISINGSHYNILDPGVGSCDPLAAEVSVAGNLKCPDCGDPNCQAACSGLQIDQTITTITISETFTVQSQAGVFFSISFCCGQCLLDAGALNSDPLNLCPGALATVPPASLTFLTPGSILRYILFSDPADTLGSVVATSNSPSFGFNPATMQEGTTYYIASVAGDDLNGNVDPNSFCLDFSNAIEVVWWPKPAVAFSVDNPNICSGECATVTAAFTGTPPFSLTYKTNFSTLTTALFPDNTGTFEICAPNNSLPGNLQLTATALTDGHCSCN